MGCFPVGGLCSAAKRCRWPSRANRLDLLRTIKPVTRAAFLKIDPVFAVRAGK